jgi:C-terminal processing protease CtpA/Prc
MKNNFHRILLLLALLLGTTSSLLAQQPPTLSTPDRQVVPDHQMTKVNKADLLRRMNDKNNPNKITSRRDSLRRAGVAIHQAQNINIADAYYAFAKIYGYMRYFNPADEAADIDWQSLAIYGAQQVATATTDDELKTTLENIFLPIAPAAQFYYKQQAPPPTPAPNNTLPQVAWQHRGLGKTENPSSQDTYLSKRTNRTLLLQTTTNPNSNAASFCTITQTINLKPYQGKKIRLQADVFPHVLGNESQAQLWVRIEKNKTVVHFYNMDDKPIKTPKLATYEIIAPVAPDATTLYFGGFLVGFGSADFSNFSLSYDDNGTWKPIKIQNPNFASVDNNGIPLEWTNNLQFASTYAISTSPNAGNKTLTIASNTQPTELKTDIIHTRLPNNATTTINLGADIQCRLPMSLPTDPNHTLPQADPNTLQNLKNELAKISQQNGTIDDLSPRVASIIIAWNSLQHFYPYFDVTKPNWEKALTESLQKAAFEYNEEPDYYNTLQAMLAPLQDAHIFISAPALNRKMVRLPVTLVRADNKIIVADPCGSQLQLGDEITEIDDTPVNELYKQAYDLASGSDQWREIVALDNLATAELGSTAQITVRRKGNTITIALPRSNEKTPSPAALKDLETLPNNIYYINLTTATSQQIAEQADKIAQAKGVIFDLRGYPNETHQVLGYLTDKTILSPIWNTPEIIYPDHTQMQYDTSGRWSITPQQPRIAGKAVFLTNANAVSYAETILGMVEYYKLATIIGSPTAGANGNINTITLPDGYKITFTGMRVLKHNNTQHHLIGIQPNILVKPTANGIANGRDEVLDRAIQFINEGK